MVTLNNRINISNRGSGLPDNSTKSAESDLKFRTNLPNASYEQSTTASPEVHKLHVSMTIQSSFSLIYWYGRQSIRGLQVTDSNGVHLV